MVQTASPHLHAAAANCPRGGGDADVWKTSPHPNRKRYPHQSIAFVIIEDYVYLVPYDVDGEVIHLRTIIPSRKHPQQKGDAAASGGEEEQVMKRAKPRLNQHEQEIP